MISMKCNDCPYYEEPRIYTMQELDTLPLGTDIWVEPRHVQTCFAMTVLNHINVSNINKLTGVGQILEMDCITRGHYRVWTARPTVEQMREAKWE